MKRLILVIGILLFGIPTYAKGEEPKELYARSAVLMDADSGRVLFEKNGYEKMPMASTTKIMTCILALEAGNLNDVVTVSENAVRQPKVHLGMQKGETFLLKDLLYSLMLESHNDSAVAIAEQIGGSVEGFARLMNERAEKLGCKDTHFVTPNGLDASDAVGKHSTTATELARILRYCIRESPKREQFLEITQTQSHSFRDLDGKRSFACQNHNAFLNMMEGALTGKTGFTGEAGYCYVGALERDERTFVVALLACGWPNNKGYKWSDTRKLMEYGLQNYAYRDVFEEQIFQPIRVVDGIPKSDALYEEAVLPIELQAKEEEREISLLLQAEERVEKKTNLPKILEAPVQKGEKIGRVAYYLNGQFVKGYSIVAGESIEKKKISWFLEKILEQYLLKFHYHF